MTEKNRYTGKRKHPVKLWLPQSLYDAFARAARHRRRSMSELGVLWVEHGVRTGNLERFSTDELAQ